MTLIDLFYQGEGIAEFAHLSVEADSTFGAVKMRLHEQHSGLAGAHLFLEGDEDPVEDAIKVGDRGGPKGLKVHVHRCKHVEVTVTFNGATAERRFSPAATIARVKHWAAEHKFHMSAEDAGEHVLQIAGTHVRPSPSTHIGTLTDGKVCAVAFDLVADERINGACEVSREWA